MEPLIAFDTTRTRTRLTEKLAVMILAELKNGPVLLTAGQVQSLAKYKGEQKKLGVEIPEYRTQKSRTSPKRFTAALAAGPFERYTPIPDWLPQLGTAASADPADPTVE
jgi:hypothetical protein